MARQPNRLNCRRCNKTFFSFEEMVFCNTDCESKWKYEEHFSKEHPKFEKRSTCQHCGEAVSSGTRGRGRIFCNHQCATLFRNSEGREQRIRESATKEKKKPKGIPIPVLNRIAEKNRVFDDKHAYWYTRRGGSYGIPGCR